MDSLLIQNINHYRYIYVLNICNEYIILEINIIY